MNENNEAVKSVRPPFWKRQYLVNKRVQFRIALAMVLEVALITCTLSLILLYINDYYLGLITYFIGTNEAEQVSLSDISRGMYWFIVGGILSSSTIFCAIGIIISHKIAGPLFRLKQYIIAVRNGKYTKEIKFRKTDQLHDLADDFNMMVMSLDIRKEIDLLYIERLEEIVRKMKAKSMNDKNGNTEAGLFVEKLSEVQSILKDLKEHKTFIFNDVVPEIAVPEKKNNSEITDKIVQMAGKK